MAHRGSQKDTLRLPFWGLGNLVGNLEQRVVAGAGDRLRAILGP